MTTHNTVAPKVDYLAPYGAREANRLKGVYSGYYSHITDLSMYNQNNMVKATFHNLNSTYSLIDGVYRLTVIGRKLGSTNNHLYMDTGSQSHTTLGYISASLPTNSQYQIVTIIRVDKGRDYLKVKAGEYALANVMFTFEYIKPL